MNAVNAVALPPELQAFAGLITDVDTHEMMPVQEWVRQFGPDAQSFADAWTQRGEDNTGDKNHPNDPTYPGDVAPVDANIGQAKGVRSPGAVIPDRRLDVMDAMGVGRSLMFPTSLGLFGLGLMFDDKESAYLPTIKGNRAELGERLAQMSNEWFVKVAAVSPRIRPVTPLYRTESVESLMSQTKELIGKGIRAFWLMAGKLPGGKSPAHKDLDPFWKLLTDNNCVATLHVGAEGQVFATHEWGNAPVFEGFKVLSEFAMSPWWTSVMHIAAQNFLATMLVGGVFQRHPTLRFGVIEVGAHWVGPMAYMLDMWHRNTHNEAFKRDSSPHSPSFYLKRNVRVSTFPFEEVDRYIEQYGLEDVLCFASDYPHVEGGRDALKTMYARVARLGPAVVEKFFVKNGELLLPD